MARNKQRPYLTYIVIALILVGGSYAFIPDFKAFIDDGIASITQGNVGAEGKDVYVLVNTKNSISRATCDLIVNMYDADGSFIDTVTTSSGVGTFGVMVKTGQVVQLQARQAAPATTTYYITPLTKVTVPLAGDSADTVSLGTLFVNQVTTSNPTMVIRNGFNNNTVVDANSQLNTTDTSFSLTIENTVTNTYYGGNSFTDMDTGKVYLSGMWVMWKGTVVQPWETAPDYTGAFDGTNVWYLWDMSSAWHDDNIADTSMEVVRMSASVGSTTFTNDATLVFDVFDTLCITDWLDHNYAAALIDAHSVGVTAITSDIT